MKNNILAAIVIVGLLVLGFLYFGHKNKTIEPTYIPYVEEETSTNTQSHNTQVTQNTQTQVTTNPPVETSSASLENIETSLFVKSVYQKNGKWWADVDYVTYMNWKELLSFQVSRGECVKTYADVEEGFATGGSGTEEEFANYVVCGGIRYTDPLMIHLVNQNPLIRSFSFASSFKTTGPGACFDEDAGDVDNPETFKNLLGSNTYSNTGYHYDLYQTQGLFVPNAIIQDGQVTEFNFPDSCAG